MTQLPLVPSIVAVVVAAAIIVGVGPRMVRVADRLADTTGLGEAFVGTVLLGISSSLPNLVQATLLITLLGGVLVLLNVPGLSLLGVHPGSLALVVVYLYGLRLVTEGRRERMWEAVDTTGARSVGPGPGRRWSASAATSTGCGQFPIRSIRGCRMNSPRSMLLTATTPFWRKYG